MHMNTGTRVHTHVHTHTHYIHMCRGVSYLKILFYACAHANMFNYA